MNTIMDNDTCRIILMDAGLLNDMTVQGKAMKKENPKMGVTLFRRFDYRSSRWLAVYLYGFAKKSENGFLRHEWPLDEYNEDEYIESFKREAIAMFDIATAHHPCWATVPPSPKAKPVNN